MLRIIAALLLSFALALGASGCGAKQEWLEQQEKQRADLMKVADKVANRPPKIAKGILEPIDPTKPINAKVTLEVPLDDGSDAVLMEVARLLGRPISQPREWWEYLLGPAVEIAKVAGSTVVDVNLANVAGNVLQTALGAAGNKFEGSFNGEQAQYASGRDYVSLAPNRVQVADSFNEDDHTYNAGMGEPTVSPPPVP